MQTSWYRLFLKWAKADAKMLGDWENIKARFYSSVVFVRAVLESHGQVWSLYTTEKILGRENTPEEGDWLNNLPDQYKWWSIHRVLLNCSPSLVIHLQKCADQLENSMLNFFDSHSLLFKSKRYSIYWTYFFFSCVSQRVNIDEFLHLPIEKNVIFHITI